MKADPYISDYILFNKLDELINVMNIKTVVQIRLSFDRLLIVNKSTFESDWTGVKNVEK